MNVLLFSNGAVQPRLTYSTSSLAIHRNYFIANSTSYMNALQLVFFNHCNITDYVFRRWVGGQEGGRGGWGTEDGLRQTFRHKQ